MVRPRLLPPNALLVKWISRRSTEAKVGVRLPGGVPDFMKYCTNCGSPIPDGQKVCSMCYGDMDYGKDGYYRQWAEEQERLAEEKRQEEQQFSDDF